MNKKNLTNRTAFPIPYAFCLDTETEWFITFGEASEEDRTLLNTFGLKWLKSITFRVISSILKAKVEYEDGETSEFNIDLFYYQLDWSLEKCDEVLRKDLKDHAEHKGGENSPSLGLARDWLILYLCP